MNCKYCGSFFEGRALGGHTVRCKLRPASELEKVSINSSKANTGRKHSIESREKISIARKKFLRENPDKVPYKLNHKHRETYPEKYFVKCLVNFLHPYRIPETLYEGDFVNPHTKTIIEIDGEQHYVDKVIVAHDIIRTKRLEELGWKIIRIRWRDFSRLNRIEKEEIIRNLNREEIVDFHIENYQKEIKKCECGKPVSDKRVTRCLKCRLKYQEETCRKFQISKEELEKLIKEKPMTEIGKMFGVSSNSIKKRCKLLKIELKPMRGYWNKIQAARKHEQPQ